MESAKNHGKIPEVVPFVLAVVAVASASLLLAWCAPSLHVAPAFARVFGESWLIAVVLLTAYFAPRVSAEAVSVAVLPAAVLAALLWAELGTEWLSVFALITSCVLFLGCLIGGYIGALLEHPGMLFAVAYVAALGDCFSVFHPHGLTANVLKNPHALAVLTLSVPVLGTTRIVPLVGIGDVAFAALFMVGARVTGLDPRRTLVALAAAMLLAVSSVELLRVSLPAVPFMSFAVVAAHKETRRLPPAQARRILLNLLVVTVLLGSLWLVARPPTLG